MSERTSIIASDESEEHYDEFNAAVSSITVDGPLFLTDADHETLWAAYLNNLPEGSRQHYNCHACRHFIQRLGGLVTIDEAGQQRPAFWAFNAPDFFRRSTESLYALVKRSKVIGVFLSSDKTLGTPRTGEWTHLAVANPKPYQARLLTAEQARAEKVEDYKMLSHGLSDYPLETVEQAVRILKSDTVYRGEKTLGIAEWFLKLHQAIHGNRSAARNLTWLAVAAAPPGFCHVRSTMINTLLDDIKNGMPFDDIARRWKDKMHPLQYQRPTAPVKDGTIKQADELVAKFGLERSLLRRYATLDDVLLKLWVPRIAPPVESSGGVFNHLRNQRKAQPVELPPVKMTWEKFKRTVLTDVLQMEIMVPSLGAFCGLMTALDADAPPIIQWDGLSGHPRNPVTWYYWHGGSSASQWGLSAGWNEVTCVFPNPSRWQEPDKFKHQKETIHFAIRGCVESRPNSLALFPEVLKSEFHGIRSVIEAHSNRMAGQCAEQGNANGLTFDGAAVQLRVQTAAGYAGYIIDRMD